MSAVADEALSDDSGNRNKTTDETLRDCSENRSRFGSGCDISPAVGEKKDGKTFEEISCSNESKNRPSDEHSEVDHQAAGEKSLKKQSDCRVVAFDTLMVSDTCWYYSNCTPQKSVAANETAVTSQETDDDGMPTGCRLYVYVCHYCDRWVEHAPGGGKCTPSCHGHEMEWIEMFEFDDDEIEVARHSR